MKLAIPIWRTRISPVFDTAENLLILETEDNHEVSRIEYPISELAPARRAKRLAELHVDVLLCGAISRPLASLMTGCGIKVISLVSGEVNDVLEAFLKKEPFDGRFLMPGCKRRLRFQDRCRRGRARNWANYPEDIV